MTAVEVLNCLLMVRLFDKTLRFKKGGLVTLNSVRRGQWLANMDVTVTGVWLGRLNANRHNYLSPTSQVKRVCQNLLEFLFIRNDVISGQHGHHAGRGARA